MRDRYVMEGNNSQWGKSYEYTIEMDGKNSQTHNITVRHPPSKLYSSLLFLLFFFFSAFLTQGISALFRLLYLVLGSLFIILFTRGAVFKESVVIIPSFGVQLETHYQCGKPVRNFVPMDKILKPMLLECVTPVTCYWSLSLMLRDEDKLMLVFSDVKPPIEMLAFIWNALCASTNSEDTLNPLPESISAPVYRTQISGGTAKFVK